MFSRARDSLIPRDFNAIRNKAKAAAVCARRLMLRNAIERHSGKVEDAIRIPGQRQMEGGKHRSMCRFRRDIGVEIQSVKMNDIDGMFAQRLANEIAMNALGLTPYSLRNFAICGWRGN